MAVWGKGSKSVVGPLMVQDSLASASGEEMPVVFPQRLLPEQRCSIGLIWNSYSLLFQLLPSAPNSSQFIGCPLQVSTLKAFRGGLLLNFEPDTSPSHHQPPPFFFFSHVWLKEKWQLTSLMPKITYREIWFMNSPVIQYIIQSPAICHTIE